MNLLDVDVPVCGDDYFTTDDYRYAPIQCFKIICDVGRAMEIAREDLEEKCNIIVREDGSIIAKKDDDEEDVLTDMVGCQYSCDPQGRDVYDLPDEEWDKLYASIPWIKCIVVYITT